VAKKPIPKRLKKEPLLEALWEIMFKSEKTSVVELLPGLIYQAFPGAYPKINRLPAANMPPAVLQNDLNLRYIPTVRLEGSPYSVQIGEHVVSLSCKRPYTGWCKFKADILELSGKLKETNLLTLPERFSLKYVDVVSMDTKYSLVPLDIELKLGNRSIHDYPVQLRTEIRENGFISIIHIITPAEASIQTGEHFDGVLVDIDTICQKTEEDFWAHFPERLDKAHDYGKELFFQLLKDTTIELLEPEY